MLAFVWNCVAKIACGSLKISEPALFPEMDNCFIALDRIGRTNKHCHSWRSLFALGLSGTFNLRTSKKELRKGGKPHSTCEKLDAFCIVVLFLSGKPGLLQVLSPFLGSCRGRMATLEDSVESHCG